MGYLKWLSLVPVLALAAEALFTPEKLISAPKRDEAVPNNAGKLALFPTDLYSFETHTKSTQFELLDIATGKTTVLTDDDNVTRMIWVDDTTVIYINSTNSDIPGGYELWIAPVDNFASRYKAASLPAPLENLRIKVTPSGDINFVLSGMVWPNGTIHNSVNDATPLSSARIYDKPFVRQWNYYTTGRTSKLFAGTLKGSGHIKTFDGKLTNLLANTQLEAPPQPGGDFWSYDMSSDGKLVAFMSKDPTLAANNYTASYIYLVPHDGSSIATAINSPTSPGAWATARGACWAPTFSPDGKTIAYYQMDDRLYEADRNKLYMYDINTGVIRGVAHNWDSNPYGITYSNDGKTIWLASEERGNSKIFSISASAGMKDIPTVVWGYGYITASYQITNTTLLASNNSLVQSYGYSIVDITGKNPLKVLLDPRIVDAELNGLSESMVEEFSFQGNWTTVHGYIIKPSNFDPTKKYPMAMIFHGGPQDSWANTWNLRWNPAVWADQGYVVVAINPTGSVGFGQYFSNVIKNDWGGAPYYDLVLGFEHVAANYKYIDTTNAIAAGASWGGYMVNWIQGKDFGRKFKAMVSHDGIFSTLNAYASDHLWFFQRDFNGTLWNNRANFERYDPARYAINWATPQLVVHSDLDYRLPISEGIQMFTILQERGVPSRFLNFPDESHYVESPENSLVWHQEVFKWINHYTGVTGTGLGDDSSYVLN
ncbi:dipeptidyl aminopeptidase [Trichophaea hybrida]|nr:dipeptidyl aminopeptidase [Trichophaea hybrida]